MELTMTRTCKPIVIVIFAVAAIVMHCLPTQAAQTVFERGKSVPVAYDVDVVVCGGGISGTIASISAARAGARTLVIDRFGRFGGNMGPGFFGGGSVHYSIHTSAGGEDTEALVNRVGLGGVPEDFLRRIIYARPNAAQMSKATRDELERMHLNIPGLRVGGGGKGLPGYAVDSLATSHVAFQMMKEAGVEMLLSAYVADPIMKGNKVRGVFVETKSGRLAVKAKVVIDATGEGDVAFRAGAPMLNRSPNCGVAFAVKGIDWALYQKHGKPKERDGFTYKRPIPGYPDAGIKIGQKQPTDGIAFARTGGGADGIDFSDAKQVTIIEREHRMHVYEYVAFMRKHSPGWKNAYLLMVAPYIGARGGRTINPERRVTHADVSARRKFPDVIYIYFHDKSRNFCDVPYRILLPKKIDGLLTAGRSSLYYGPNLRQRWSVMLNAQAAGMAAAQCVADRVEPRKLNVKKLQKALLAAGCPLGEGKRLEELGLK